MTGTAASTDTDTADARDGASPGTLRLDRLTRTVDGRPLDVAVLTPDLRVDKAAGRADVEHGASPALDHGWHEPAAEVDHRLDIEVEETKVFGHRHRGEVPGEADARAVAQDGDGPCPLRDLGDETLTRRRIGEIADETPG